MNTSDQIYQQLTKMKTGVDDAAVILKHGDRVEVISILEKEPLARLTQEMSAGAKPVAMFKIAPMHSKSLRVSGEPVEGWELLYDPKMAEAAVDSYFETRFLGGCVVVDPSKLREPINNPERN